MRKLTPQESSFVQQFIADKNFLQKRKITKQFVQFDRRKKKAAESLALLPAGDSRRQLLEKSLAAAGQKAAAGQFADAYQDLYQVKQDARQAAKSYTANLSPESVRLELNRLDRAISALISDLDEVADEMANIYKALDRQPKASACQTALEAVQRRDAFLSGKGAALQSRLAQVRGLQQSALAAAPSPELSKQFLEMGHAIDTLAKTAKQPTQDLTATFRKLVEKSKRDGKILTEQLLQAEFQRQLEEFDRRFAAITRLPPGQDLNPAMKDLTRRQEEKVEKVQARFAEEFGADRRLLDNTAVKPRAVAGRSKFDTEGFITDLFQGFGNLTDDTLDAFCDEVETELAEQLGSLRPNSDVLFDLALKSERDFALEIARSKGMYVDPRSEEDKEDNVPRPPNPENLRVVAGPARTQILTIAKRMAAAVAENHPNRASAKTTPTQVTPAGGLKVVVDVPDSFQCNGASYQKPRVLGAGGNGVAVRYEDQNGGYVVLKSLLPGKDREDMTRELIVHRHVMGGEDGQGHENVAGLKGTVVGPNGGLHMVMEYVEGGDVDKFSDGLQAACQSGIISPQARDAVVQHVFLEALKGLQVVQARNATHHDIKAGNYLITNDGKVKLADFGSGQIAANTQGKVSGDVAGVTPNMEAPELNQPDEGTEEMRPVTGKADVYTLGVMLAHLTSATDATEEKPDFSSHMDQRKYRHEQSGMALDRLKNALLDPDPDKRPSLEAAALSTYLEAPNSVLNGTPEVAELLPALIAYTKELGGQGTELQRRIMVTKGTILKLEKEKEGARPSDLTKINKKIADERQNLDTWQPQLDLMHQAMRIDPRKKKVLEDLERLDRLVRGYEPQKDDATIQWEKSARLLRQIKDLEGDKKKPGISDEEIALLDDFIGDLREEQEQCQAALVDLADEAGKWVKDDETGEWAPANEDAAATNKRRAQWYKRRIRTMEAEAKAGGGDAEGATAKIASLQDRLGRLPPTPDASDEEQEEEQEEDDAALKRRRKGKDKLPY